MAVSSSSYSSVHPRKYGVFLSFRGEDTRDNFVSHLHEALRQHGIPTFLDSEALDRGKYISTIFQEIEKSNVAVIIFSKDYASSHWCLDELSKIMECNKTNGLEVLPVFYYVDPADVKKQTGSFAGAFDEHVVNFSADKVLSWRNALKDVARISGWSTMQIRPESALIKEILRSISNSLNHFYSNDFTDLICIHRRLEQIELLLSIGQADVHIIGIWGMGGIGKTTLAKAIFDKYSYQFEGTCFLENVREESEKLGLHQLRRKLLEEVLNEGTISANRAMSNNLCHKKVFLVLDDVDKISQLESLVGKREWFRGGSRIIVTGRDKQVLKYAVDTNCMYEVPLLVDSEALQVFKSFAFKEEPYKEDYMTLSRRFVTYTKGNPLALKVLGSSLRGKSKQEWKSAYQKIKRNPPKDVMEVLRISYERLDHHDQQLFLDIACFFNGFNKFSKRPFCKDDSEVILDSLGFSTSIGVSNLVDKALITISNSSFIMHDLLQELGHQIVRQEDIKEPGGRSRLHDLEDIHHVLSKNTGTEHVEGILVNLCKIPRFCVPPPIFCKMNQVKFLRLESNVLDNLGAKQFPQGLECLPRELRYLCWNYYPWKSLPSNFKANNVVILNLSFSRIERLWIGVKDLPNLKHMDMLQCEYLIEMPDFSEAPNLETLDFIDCWSLTKVYNSIVGLTKLKELNLHGCMKLSSIPNIGNLTSLTNPNLGLCMDIKEVGLSPSNPTTLGRLERHNEDLSRHPHTKTLVGNSLSSLWRLNLSHTNIKTVSTSMKDLLCLEVLIISHCWSLISLPELPPRICVLDASYCTSMTSVSSSRFSHVQVEKGMKWYFSFTECEQLNQIARRNIWNMAQMRIMLMASKCEPHLQSVGDNLFFLTLPDEKIPVGQYKPGSAVTIKLPINWCSIQFLGFALSIVFEADCYLRDRPSNNYECQLKSKFGDSNFVFEGCLPVGSIQSYRKNNLLVHWYDPSFLKKLKNDHGSCFGDNCNMYNEASLYFNNGFFYGKVKEWGIQLLYGDNEEM